MDLLNESAAPAGELGGSRRGGLRNAGRLVWLAYLALYPAPWFLWPPSRPAVIASVIGISVFLAVYLHGALAKPRSLLPHVAATALIGFALSPFGGVWTVFNVYASSFAGRLSQRRTAVTVLLVLQATLVVFAVSTRQPLFNWFWGLFFGVMTGFATAWQSDLERKNQRLEQAQGEVRALAETAERERIARDLHDLLGHTLTLVAIKADLAARLVDRDASAARREMQEVAGAAREALAEVRTAVAGMRGATLAAEIERAKRMLSAANVRARVEAGAELGDPQREAVLAMALREAVTNVIRHAGATCCTIGVDAEPQGAFRLSVADDGRGGDIMEGSGLLGMRARLSAAGGVLKVESDAKGTRLLACLPRAAA